jgi:hypothetical protein
MDQSLERWLPVIGYEGLYEVSDHGRVRSLPRIVLARRNGGVFPRKVKGFLLAHSKNSYGYPMVMLCINGAKKWKPVHTLVMRAFVGPSNGLDVRHLDGSRENNVLTNLCYGTRAENVADSRAHGTIARGTKNGHARLTDAQVRFARSMKRTNHVSQKQLANIWGVDPSTVSYAVSGASWGWL